MNTSQKSAVPAELRRQLQQSATPAWLIDASGASVVWANGAGRRAWGFSGAADKGGWLLDRAMPALAQLMALDKPGFKGDQGLLPGQTAWIEFWTPKGIWRRNVLCRQIAGAGCGLMLVTAGVDDDGSAEAAGAFSIRQAPLPDGTPDPDPDLAVLREIARRIRGDAGANGVVVSPAMMEGANTSCRPAAAGEIQPLQTAAETSMPSTVTAGNTEDDVLKKTAHELRTPISAIHMVAQIMTEERFGPIDNPRYKDYAKDLLATAGHALNVIEAMMEPRGPGTGVRQVPTAELDLDALIASTLSGLRPLIERAGLTISYLAPPHLPALTADATAVRQMLLNLLTNAIKFTAAGGAITVSAAYEPGGGLRLAVKDNGAGMSAAEISALMMPATAPAVADKLAAGHDLQGLANAKAGLGKGLGLGLAITRSLAEANGARLELASRPGIGTTASVIFAKDRVVTG